MTPHYSPVHMCLVHCMPVCLVPNAFPSMPVLTLFGTDMPFCDDGQTHSSPPLPPLLTLLGMDWITPLGGRKREEEEINMAGRPAPPQTIM